MPTNHTSAEHNLKENATIWKLASFGEYEGVKALVDHGVHAQEQDERGFTPLTWAARNGHMQVRKDTNGSISVHAEFL